jgi:hypothetical protein
MSMSYVYIQTVDVQLSSATCIFNFILVAALRLAFSNLIRAESLEMMQEWKASVSVTSKKIEITAWR